MLIKFVCFIDIKGDKLNPGDIAKFIIFFKNTFFKKKFINHAY